MIDRSESQPDNIITNTIQLNHQSDSQGEENGSGSQQNDLALASEGRRPSFLYKVFSSALELCKQEIRLLNTQRVSLKIAGRNFRRNIVGGYNFTEEEPWKQGNSQTDSLKSVWLKGCEAQQRFCLIPLNTHKPKTTTASVQTNDNDTISDLEILLSKLLNNHDIKIEVLVTKKNGEKSKINARTLLENIGQHKNIIDDLSPPSMATQTLNPVMYRDISCQTESYQTTTIGCQTATPARTDASAQATPQLVSTSVQAVPRCIEAFVQAAPKLTSTHVQAVSKYMEAFVQASPQLTNRSVQAVSEYTEAFVQASPTLIAHAAVVKTFQVQTTKDVYSQVPGPTTTLPGLKEAFAKTSPALKYSAVLASSVSNIQHSSLKLSKRSSESGVCFSNTDIGGREKRATSSAAGEAPSFTSVIDFKSIIRANLQRFENHSATLPGRVFDIPNRIQYSCPVPMISKAFGNKTRKTRFDFILGVEPTVQLTSSAALLAPAYFAQKTEAESRRQEDIIVEDKLLNGSLKENFDIASLVYIDSFGNFSMNHDVMMDMFGYDPRQSPFLPSGYEASSDLPDDLDSVIVPSIRSKDIVFHKNEDESFKEIGRGSYGVVYLGHLLKTSKQIVVKDFFNESVCWELVEHEARIVALLQGKDVTPTFHGILTSTIDENDFSLVQEFFGSGSIETILKHHGDLSAKSWITICVNISKTLFNIHSCHVIHNDVKADNILVDLDGFDVRFIDFGMSTFRKGLEFTASPDYMSKFQFLAPEVRENCHSTPQSDVFSLGFLFGQIMSQAKVIQLRPLWKSCTSVRALSRPRLPHIIATLEEIESNLQPKLYSS